MNSLTKQIESIIKNAIDEYIKCISSKYEEIDVDDLEKIWNDVMKISEGSGDSTGKTVTKIPKTLPTSPKKKTQPSENEKSSGCPYKFIKGTKQDQICGSKIKDGVTYCSRHKKFDGSEQKERKSSPIPQKSSVNPVKSKSKSPEKSVARVLRRNKTLDKLWHPETGFVFRSNNERVVTGKFINEKLQPLTENDIDECRRWGFPFDKEDEDKEDVDKKTEIYLVAPSSSGQKFWECKISGTKYVTRHGKIGTDGSTKEKVFDTYDNSVKEMEKTIKSKQKKGYSEKIKSKSKNDSCDTPSDIENAIDELQGTSSDQFEEDEEENKKRIKKFIPSALGLKEKVVKNDDEGEDEDE